MDKQQGLNSVLQEKFHNRINAGIERSKDALLKIEKDGNLLNDFILNLGSNRRLRFKITDPSSGYVNKLGVLINTQHGDDFYFMHPHAVEQAGVKLGVPQAYIRNLAESREKWQAELASEILNKHAENGSRQRVLVREIGGTVKGILSDQYRRLNTGEIYKSFLSAVGGQGGIVYSAFADDTRSSLEVAYPELQTISTRKNGDILMGFGMRISNSDFGDGALELRAFLIQGVCLNGLVLESKIREIHLGSRLPDNIALSETTYRRDTQLQASLASDMVKGLMSPKAIQENAKLIVDASEQSVDLEKEFKQLPKTGLSKKEVEEVKSVITNNRVEDGVQGENTLFKLAQSISAVARDKEERRKRELEEISGKVLLRAK